MSDPDEAIDLYQSRSRSIGIVAIGLAFAAVSAAYLRWGGAAPGSLRELAGYAGVLLGLVGIVGGFWVLTRKGPVVTIGRRGIFDRRMATGWIPWEAIRSIETRAVRRTSFLMLEPDPSAEPGLPIKPWVRRLKGLNAGLGFRGYSIAATTLVGGFPALIAAVHAHAPAQAGGLALNG